MKKYWIYKYLYLWLHCVALVTSESYYSIIAPGTLKSNHKYTVAITIYDVAEPCSISVSILGRSYNASVIVDLQSFETKVIEFLPPKLLHGGYKLIAEGITGINFKNESKIYRQGDTGPKMYIQTDKFIYKPQDLVQFRVIILDEHTRPAHIREPKRVEILDHHGNRIKQFKGIKLISGVYTGNFQLADHPVLGNWEIKVIISGKIAYSQSKKISVQKYILPKFSVFILTEKNILLQDGVVTAIIYGKYTFGKYVKGNATVELWDPSVMNKLQEIKLDLVKSGSVVFDTKNYTGSYFENMNQLKLVAKLTEQQTGITQTYDVDLNVHKQQYRIVVPDRDIELRNNKPFRLKVQVEHLTGAAVLDSKTPITMVHGNKTYESNLDINGIASFEFEHQPDADHKIIYKDSTTYLPNIDYVESPETTNPHSYCKLTLLDKRIRLGKPVEIEVSSIINIPYLFYTIVGHASIIRMEYIKVPANTTKYTIQITPSIDIVPKSIIYVHYIENGNLRYDELDLNFPDELENQISIIAPMQVRPGEEINIELRAQPDSYVSILAVDIGVYFLNSEYDIYKSDIIKSLQNDVSYTIPIGSTVYPGLLSGVVTLTNAHFQFSAKNGDKGRSGGGGFDESVEPKFRTKFPETWIFQNIAVNQTSTNLTFNIPDTITTWRITAFSNNKATGFGVVDRPTDITSIKRFFLTLNLPYSIKIGEVLNIPVTIFNYHNQPVDTEVILYNNEQEFEFMESIIHSSQTDDKQQVKEIKLPAVGGETVSFLIKPKKLGEIYLKVSATTSMFSDAVHQKLKVEPGGLTKQHNQAMYLSVEQAKMINYSLSVQIPMDSVPDSENITMSVGGDYIVPTLENLHDLVQMPLGCGEQNMLNLASNTLILEYLKVTGEHNNQKDLVRNVMSNIEMGYQRQLAFRHENGGYSVFGEKPESEASSWLTAYVARFFIIASKLSLIDGESILIEPRIIESCMDYLALQQFDDGEFEYTGYLLNPQHESKYGFTAFVLLTFLEDYKYSTKYQKTIQAGLQFLNSNLDEISDVYSLSLTAAALNMAKHNNFHKVVNKLKLLSKEENGLTWWTANDNNIITDIEITSYILMALLDTVGDHTSILKWLIKQRNAQGGFHSTHDTVLGLQALVKYSQKFNNQHKKDLKITYTAIDLSGNKLKEDHFTVVPENMLNLQTHRLPRSTRDVSLEVNGTGYFLLQLSYQYNVIQKDQANYFLIEPKANLRYGNELVLDICFTYLSELEDNDVTNMVVMKVNLPSGFISEAESDKDLLEMELIQLIETENGKSTVIFYFQFLFGKVEQCVHFSAQQVNDVMMRKPVPIKMHDYYKEERSNTIFYNI